MAKSYNHLTKDQRCQIDTLLKRGDSPTEISNALNIHRSTVYREINRNRGQRGYRYNQAHCKAVNRRKKIQTKPKKLTKTLREKIRKKLKIGWSPEQISGRMKLENPDQSVSFQTIYKYISRNKLRGGKLYKSLPHRGKKYNKGLLKNSGRGLIPNRRDIEERPKIVEKKCRLGDWELDTIIGAEHKGVVVSMVERASKLVKLISVPSKAASEVKSAILKKLSILKKDVFTLTADNGKEFSYHESISEALEAEFFFAKPYRSWERGLNEHTNGLFRRYYPKSSKLDQISEREMAKVEKLLNERPRKVLNFKTPVEAYDELSTRSHLSHFKIE